MSPGLDTPTTIEITRKLTHTAQVRIFSKRLEASTAKRGALHVASLVAGQHALVKIFTRGEMVGTGRETGHGQAGANNRAEEGSVAATHRSEDNMRALCTRFVAECFSNPLDELGIKRGSYARAGWEAVRLGARGEISESQDDERLPMRGIDVPSYRNAVEEASTSYAIGAVGASDGRHNAFDLVEVPEI